MRLCLRRFPIAEDADRSALLTALTTEHLALQAAADTTFSDAAARSSLYVFALSSSLVALGFFSQSPALLPLMVAIVLPAIFLLGVLTIVRLVDSSLENMQYLTAIARIRGYYRTMSPTAETYFAARHGRWPEGPDPALGLGAFIAFLGTTATMIACINSVVAGVGVALLVYAVVGADSVVIGLAAGVVTAMVILALFLVFQRWRFASVTVAADDMH